MYGFKLFSKYGRVGNMLFQWMALSGMARRNSTRYCLPKNDFFDYFERRPPIDKNTPASRTVKEQYFHYCPELFNVNPDEFIDFQGSFQSDKYWDCDREYARWQLKFTDRFINHVKSKMALPDGDYVSMHVRRGDYVGNKNYVTLSPDYYRQVIDKHFNGRKIICFSDDYRHVRELYKDFDVIYPPIDLSPVETICAMNNVCSDYILSNSTFAWWGAYLSSNDKPTVVHPDRYFSGALEQSHSIKDFWPDGWIEHKEEKIKHDLSDVTFIIPISHDSVDRKQNVELIIYFLQDNFKTNIILGEQGSGGYYKYMSRYVKYHYFADITKFHRTKMLNDMTTMAETPIVVNWDADVVVPVRQLLRSVQMIRTNEADMVYPYDGRFIRMQRIPIYKCWQKDIRQINSYTDRGNYGVTTPQVSVGGAVAFNKETYLSIGGENERFISFGREDVERNIRARRVGLRVRRVRGCLYHLDHYVGENSSVKHKYMQGNKDEYNKVEAMGKEELLDYIASWPWLCKTHNINND